MSPFVERYTYTDAVTGAAPLGSSLINAVHNKLKSVGAETAIIQG